MRRALLLAVVLAVALGLGVAGAKAQDVWVDGYTRSDGTYVQGHYRTAPDGNPYNNYSYPGNYNPNTGEITGGDPDTYLDNYGRESSSGSASTYRYTPRSYSVSRYRRTKIIQEALRGLGIDPGPIDGVMGEKTKRAVRQFQRWAAIEVDGVAGKNTLEAMLRAIKDDQIVEPETDEYLRLSGRWLGELTRGSKTWTVVMTLRQNGASLNGTVLKASDQVDGVSVLWRVEGKSLGQGMTLEEVRVLREARPSNNGNWCSREGRLEVAQKQSQKILTGEMISDQSRCPKATLKMQRLGY